VPDFTSPPPRGIPLRPSEIKYAVYGRSGRGGLRFDRVLYAGWSFYPAPGIVAKDVKKLGLDLQSFRVPLTSAIKLVVIPSIRKNFAVGGRPEPGWEPLAEYTIKVRGTAWPILVRSGALKRAATSFSIWTVGKESASIRSLPSSVWYGNLHQAGYGSLGSIARRELGAMASREDIEERVHELFMGARPPHKQTKFVIPQREFAMFQEQDVEKIQEIFVEWMEAQADKVGRGWRTR
jgi:phage gpG-like protein